MAPFWSNMAVSLLLSAGVVSGQTPSSLGASPGYRARSTVCPERCLVSGPNPSNWSVYNSMDQLANCTQAMYYGFNLYNNVDDGNAHHRIFACTSYGSDWVDNEQSHRLAERPAEEHKTIYEIGWWSNSFGTESEYRALIRQMRDYVVNRRVSSSKTAMLYARVNGATAGLYIGNSLRSSSLGSVALDALVEDSHRFDGRRDALAIQLCGPDYDPQHVFGFIALGNGTFGAIQSAFESWSNAECLRFDHSTNFTASAHFMAPMLSSVESKNSTFSRLNTGNSTMFANSRKRWIKGMPARRDECKTEKVQQNDSCAELAKRCGISGSDFSKYNSEKGFCSKLRPGQHVCCSSGNMPDFRPKPNDDGSCATTTVGDGENCATIAAANSLTNDDIDNFNKHTWAWTGCKNIFKDAVICISKGSPPMPAEIPDAECGPQVPGTKPPKDMTKLAELNQCPLNACCNAWGHCGTTPEFCTDTGTGAPGTAKAGTNGCISNCGTKVVKGSAPAEYRSVGYYESYQFKRDCLYQDAEQIDGSKYTHLHFGFGDISPDYEISIGDDMAKYQFNNFRYISGPKKILSFGGWDFSTQPETYQILRQGTAPANRKKLATNIANFIKDNDLDGVDIDWEYPGALDIPGVPPGDKKEGDNYLAFLVLLKNLLPGKSVSIAAPASYWYLKGFPIGGISKVVDYIVFMSYDLHGQWDAENPNGQIGCDDGMCLRSHVNLTETMTSLAMVTKAGADSGKIVVGVSSYGRSFKMASAGCYGPDCKYTGGRLNSDAKAGSCTNTAGYIANAEIEDIINGHNSSRLNKRQTHTVNKQFIDEGSNSNILVYDDTEWVAYMTPEVRAQRANLYKGLNMGGTVNWATDLEEFHDPPPGFASWSDLKLQVKAGVTPVRHATSRRGNWTELACDDPYYREVLDYSPAERWGGLSVGDAWSDLVQDWKKYRDDTKKKPAFGFTGFISYLIGGPPSGNCAKILSGSNCRQTLDCKEFDNNNKTGPAAAALIWNSFVKISSTYAEYHESLVSAASLLIDNSLDDLENKFAPAHPIKQDEWLTELLDFISMGTPVVSSKFFTETLSEMSALSEETTKTLSKIKETFSSMLSGSVQIAEKLRKHALDPEKWTSNDQDEYSKYMGQSLYVWDKIITKDLEDLFDGSDKSIERLTTLMAGGTFIDGARDSKAHRKRASNDEVEATEAQKKTVSDSFITAFYGFFIPMLWQASGQHPFIIDTGRGCDDKGGSPLSADLSSACHEGRLYRLGTPANGKSHPCNRGATGSPALGGERCQDMPFSSPKGEGELNGKNWGGVKTQDIIIGAVRTYKDNGSKNQDGFADPTVSKVFESLAQDKITAPGFISLPVCTENHARLSWENSDGNDSVRKKKYFPCNHDVGKDLCGASTFVDQTDNGSPSVSDCLTIVKNIEGTDGSWRTFIEVQREILSFGTCKFGVTGKGRKGNSQFNIGGQDVVDIIEESIKRFSKNGKVGAKGKMECNGNIKQQDVEWALY